MLLVIINKNPQVFQNAYFYLDVFSLFYCLSYIDDGIFCLSINKTWAEVLFKNYA